MIRCEVYMEMLGQKRNLPKPPERDPSIPLVSTAPPKPKSPDVRQRSPQYKVPTDIAGARRKAEARKKAKCPVDDPLCGEL